MRVKNRKCIRRLSFKSLWASRKRNIIAICAIALTRFGANKALTMTLIPTMNCNFRCPYCYEKDKKYPVKKMTTEVMDYSSCKKGRVKL